MAHSPWERHQLTSSHSPWGPLPADATGCTYPHAGGALSLGPLAQELGHTCHWAVPRSWRRTPTGPLARHYWPTCHDHPRACGLSQAAHLCATMPGCFTLPPSCRTLQVLGGVTLLIVDNCAIDHKVASPLNLRPFPDSRPPTRRRQVEARKSQRAPSNRLKLVPRLTHLKHKLRGAQKNIFKTLPHEGQVHSPGTSRDRVAPERPYGPAMHLC